MFLSWGLDVTSVSKGHLFKNSTHSYRPARALGGGEELAPPVDQVAVVALALALVDIAVRVDQVGPAVLAHHKAGLHIEGLPSLLDFPGGQSGCGKGLCFHIEGEIISKSQRYNRIFWKKSGLKQD